VGGRGLDPHEPGRHRRHGDGLMRADPWPAGLAQTTLGSGQRQLVDLPELSRRLWLDDHATLALLGDNPNTLSSARGSSFAHASISRFSCSGEGSPADATAARALDSSSSAWVRVRSSIMVVEAP